MANVQLQVSQMTAGVEGSPGASQVTLTILSQTGIGSTALFVVEQATNTATPEFLYVATLADVNDLPTAPNFTTDDTIFRTNVITVIADLESDIDAFVESCKRRLQALAIAASTVDSYSSSEVFNLSA